MRVLIYVPIVHSASELGTMAGAVRTRYEQAYGEEHWAAREPSIEAMWSSIRRRLFEMHLSWDRTRIYQDGMPMCGRELDIARDVASQGSLNYELVLQLVDRGAHLMGTEDPQLMIREYTRMQALLRAATARVTGAAAAELKREGDELLRARDAFIVDRIQTTLQDGETGILFIGLLHRVDERLGPGLRVQHLINNLPLRADVFRRLED